MRVNAGPRRAGSGRRPTGHRLVSAFPAVGGGGLWCVLPPEFLAPAGNKPLSEGDPKESSGCFLPLEACQAPLGPLPALRGRLWGLRVFTGTSRASRSALPGLHGLRPGPASPASPRRQHPAAGGGCALRGASVVCLLGKGRPSGRCLPSARPVPGSAPACQCGAGQGGRPARAETVNKGAGTEGLSQRA